MHLRWVWINNSGGVAQLWWGRNIGGVGLKCTEHWVKHDDCALHLNPTPVWREA